MWAPRTELEDLQFELDASQEQSIKQLDEILDLYRRIHIELDDMGRSGLIIDLFTDPRNPVRLLGFELADRDLSGSTDLTQEVGDTARMMLDDPDALIRSKAAILITRLVLPDAMMVLTASLERESDPTAAAAMLAGIARWPNPEASEPVLSWFIRNNSAFEASCDAVWALEEAGLWNPETEHPILIDHIRTVDPSLLNRAGMKLIAKLGDAQDLQLLVNLLLTENTNQQQWAANALVNSPRAVELLVQAAEGNSLLFQAAADSLILHRTTPEGLRRLASLPADHPDTRLEALVRMGRGLDNDRLAEAVRLANLSNEHTALLLNRLLTGNGVVTPRVAKGIILLAQTELDNARPNRALEAAIALDNISLDPNERTKIRSTKAISLMMLGRIEEAFELSREQSHWYEAFSRTPDHDLRDRIGRFMLDALSESMTADRVNEIRLICDQSKAGDPR